MTRKIKTVLLTGFLGAGKTTLLSSLLTDKSLSKSRIAVLVNDFGALPVDGALLPDGDHYVTEINKGSIFCVCVKTDLLKNLAYIASEIKPDVLFIEATGAAEPTDFTALIQSEHLRDSYQRGSTLCVVDALNFTKLVTILPALSAQVQISDHIVINKVDLVDDRQLTATTEAIQKISPSASIIKTSYGKLDLADIDLFGDRSEHKEFDGDFHLCSEAPTSTSSYEFRTNNHVDKQYFYELLDKYRNFILRAKGIVDFGSNKLYVEVVNGVVSSKHPGHLSFGQEAASAMSFIFRNNYCVNHLINDLKVL